MRHLITILISMFIGTTASAVDMADFEAGRDGAVSLAQEGLTIAVDSRVELLAIVQHFTGWAAIGHIKSQTEYKQNIDRQFKSFADHSAVTHMKKLIAAGFSYDAPVNFIFCHGFPPEFEQRRDYSDYLIGRAGGIDELTILADELRDFARQSDFMTFFNSHRPLYDTLVAEVGQLLSGMVYVDVLEDFYGRSMKSYNLICTPLFSGNYGISAGRGDRQDLYAVIGPCSLRGERTTFACFDYLESIALHEWSHSFVNRLVDQNWELFELSSHLFIPISRMMQRQAYPNWRVTLYEHLVRACGEIHLRGKVHEEFDKRSALRYHEGKGFWYISHIVDLIGDYENQRDRYPAFGDFIPVIANELSQLSVSDLSARITAFRGPLDAIFARTDRIFLVYPTRIREELRNMIKTDLEDFAGFLRSAKIEPVIISDQEALELEWQDKVAFIFATPQSNLFLEQLDLDIPLNTGQDAIELGAARYEDEGILLVTCAPNPLNRSLPFAICVANQAEDLLDIHSRISSPSEWRVDYVLYQENEKLESGMYEKSEGEWLLAP
jgi:hypothetical protein